MFDPTPLTQAEEESVASVLTHFESECGRLATAGDQHGDVFGAWLDLSGIIRGHYSDDAPEPSAYPNYHPVGRFAGFTGRLRDAADCLLGR